MGRKESGNLLLGRVMPLVMQAHVQFTHGDIAQGTETMPTIREERLRRSLTQKRLAFEAGIDPRTLRKLEKGEKVSPESVLAVCRVLDMDPVGNIRSDVQAAPSKDRACAETKKVFVHSFLSLAPIAILLPAALIALSIPAWSLQSLVSACIAAIFFAVLFDLPNASRPRSFIGAGLVALSCIVMWQRQMHQAEAVSLHVYAVLIALILSMLSTRLRDVILPRDTGGERSFVRIVIAMLAIESYYGLRWDYFEFWGTGKIWDFYRWGGYPVVSIAALAILPFPRLRAATFIAVGFEHAVRLPDFPVLLYFGGSSQVRPEVIFEWSLWSMAWDGTVGILALFCALPYCRPHVRLGIGTIVSLTGLKYQRLVQTFSQRPNLHNAHPVGRCDGPPVLSLAR